MPSPNARRVAPTISDEIKKKIQTAQKYKENRVKKSVKKENIAEVVEFLSFLIIRLLIV